MARLFKSSAAKRLELPGRVSLEPISGEAGSRITVRVVEIPPAKPGDTPRGPPRARRKCIPRSRHADAGRTVSESGDIRIGPGDMVLIPANEKHMTNNIGSEPLILLCFFPAPDVSARTTEFPRF